MLAAPADGRASADRFRFAVPLTRPRSALRRSEPAASGGTLSTDSSEFRRGPQRVPLRLALLSERKRPVCTRVLSREIGAPRGSELAKPPRDGGSGQAAPIGAETFAPERRSHFKTLVWRLSCALRSIDTRSPRDRLGAVKNL